MFAFLKKWLRRRMLHASHVTPEQWARAEAHMPFLARLDGAERRRLHELALQFLSEKALQSAAGFSLSNEARLTIALQAVLPILNLGLDWYEGWVEVVVYPGEFIVPRSFMDEDGVVHEYADVLAGEAWEGGPVILSWPEEGDTAAGVNVVIHEFVHKLDMRNGTPRGQPPLHAGMSRTEWARDFSAAFAAINAQLDNGEETALDPYAAEHPAEFFAVASEAFFVDPARLKAAYAAVYRHLAAFYRQEPLPLSPNVLPAGEQDADSLCENCVKPDGGE
ncbi:MAG: zinc-dependent peptidase [Sulfuricella sp.]|nr:zinc-dependent peptidase [Sulfuricella sp.]